MTPLSQECLSWLWWAYDMWIPSAASSSNGAFVPIRKAAVSQKPSTEDCLKNTQIREDHNVSIPSRVV